MRVTRQAVNRKTDSVQPCRLACSLEDFDTILRRAMDRPVIEVVLMPELERNHALLLHFPRSIHGECFVEVLPSRPRRILFTLCDHQTARGSDGSRRSVTCLRARLAVYLRQLLNIGPRDLRSKKYAIGQPGGPPCCSFALGSHLDRRVGLLIWRETHPASGYFRILAFKGDFLSGPKLLHELDRFLELGSAVL